MKTSAIVIKLKHDLKEFAILAAYLYVCLSAIIFYKMAIVGGSGDGFWPFGLPALKAVLLAKFMMLGHAIRLGDGSGERRIIQAIALKAFLYLLLLILLSFVEEMVVGLIHGHAVAVTLNEILTGKTLQILAASLIMLLILVPYFAAGELNAGIEGGLWQKFLERQSRPTRHLGTDINAPNPKPLGGK